MEGRRDWQTKPKPPVQHRTPSSGISSDQLYADARSSVIHPAMGALGWAKIIALQRSAGNAAVQRLIKLTEPPRAARVLTSAEQKAFVTFELATKREEAEGLKIIQDMAAAGDVMDFASRDELRTELIKRMTMIDVMQDSQVTSKGMSGFGYPFSKGSPYWGARVGIAAKDFWEPAPPDGYSLREDPDKRAQIRHLSRKDRHTVYGDQNTGDYSFKLNAKGAADPFEAIQTLFVPKLPHERTLIHCDHLVSLVHFRALMAAIGKHAFNTKIKTYGPDKITLRWDLFKELGKNVELGENLPGAAPGTTRPGLGSVRVITPKSPADLVIGDHVVFSNHKSYQTINQTTGNAWQLENAVLIDRSDGIDHFMGHGSGRKTEAAMRSILAAEYNDVAEKAHSLIKKTKTRDPAARAAAEAQLAFGFGVVQIKGKWRVVGTTLSFNMPFPFDGLTPDQIPGLKDPTDTKQMAQVHRPIESA